MATIHQASAQWASRPADQRFTSLETMLDHFGHQRRNSRQLNTGSKSLHAVPTDNTTGAGLQIVGFPRPWKPWGLSTNSIAKRPRVF